jgi:hypothetical protein
MSLFSGNLAWVPMQSDNIFDDYAAHEQIVIVFAFGKVLSKEHRARLNKKLLH